MFSAAAAHHEIEEENEYRMKNTRQGVPEGIPPNQRAEDKMKIITWKEKNSFLNTHDPGLKFVFFLVEK